MHKLRPSWPRGARRSSALGPSPLTTRRKVTEAPPPGRIVPRVPRKPAPAQAAHWAPRAPVTSSHGARGRPWSRCAQPHGAPGWTDMARELRTLLLWGRRLRAPALAATPGGEGNRTGGRDGMHGGSEAASPSVGRNLCPISLARRGRHRFVRSALGVGFHRAPRRSGLRRPPAVTL